MKLRLLRTKTFEEADAAALDTAILAWVGATGLTTRQLLSIHYAVTDVSGDSRHCALIAYTD